MMFGSSWEDNLINGFSMWVMLGFAVAAVKGVRYLVKSEP
jgi:hypothetical protein